MSEHDRKVPAVDSTVANELGGEPETGGEPGGGFSVSRLQDAGEQSLARAASAAQASGQLLRLRLPFQLWDGEQYVSWRGQTWRIDVRNAEEAKQLQEAMQEFFDLTAKLGPGHAAARIKELSVKAIAPAVAGGQEPDSASTAQFPVT